MKTSTLYRAEKQSRRSQHMALDKMEAIAYGVQARFEENTGYSRRVTDATINVARALGNMPSSTAKLDFYNYPAVELGM